MCVSIALFTIQLFFICIVSFVLKLLPQILHKIFSYRAKKERIGKIKQLPRLKYTSDSIECNECSICCAAYTTDDTVIRLSCDKRHVFHARCLERWIISVKSNCPNCRAALF